LKRFTYNTAMSLHQSLLATIPTEAHARQRLLSRVALLLLPFALFIVFCQVAGPRIAVRRLATQHFATHCSAGEDWVTKVKPIKWISSTEAEISISSASPRFLRGEPIAVSAPISLWCACDYHLIYRNHRWGIMKATCNGSVFPGTCL
jgi:hypothetical protein